MVTRFPPEFWDNCESFADVLREVRKDDKDITLEQLTGRLKTQNHPISRATLARYEQYDGRFLPKTPHDVRAIAKALDCTDTELARLMDAYFCSHNSDFRSLEDRS